MSIAEKSVKNSKTSSIKLTEDNNKMYWKAELKTPNNDDEHEVIMDAKTGKIIDKDIDD